MLKVKEKELREEYTSYFKNENYWNLLKMSIALNIDGAIKHLDSPNINEPNVECCVFGSNGSGSDISGETGIFNISACALVTRF